MLSLNVCRVALYQKGSLKLVCRKPMRPQTSCMRVSWGVSRRHSLTLNVHASPFVGRSTALDDDIAQPLNVIRHVTFVLGENERGA